jgi:putative pyruvate formate lyase activating enzyme
MEKTETVKIAWWGKHFGEEPPLVGDMSQGAGGIFFSGCNLKCAYCQNYQISQDGLGKDYAVEQLADIMMELEKMNAANIDLVTPTIWWRQIKQAILAARAKGLSLPVVWNSNAYEAPAILEAMEGLVDVYLPDFKYADSGLGYTYSGVYNFPVIALAAIREMLRQNGNFNPDTGKGVIVRHLVLPGNINNSLRALDMLAGIDNNLYISLMSQYYPIHKACLFPELNMRVSAEDFRAVYDHLLQLGFANGWVQDESSADTLQPDFTRADPFAAIET